MGGKSAINARDRIGNGPWVNSAGVQVAANVDELHSATSKINVEIGRSENGWRIPGRRFVVNQHDILTGSTADVYGALQVQRGNPMVDPQAYKPDYDIVSKVPFDIRPIGDRRWRSRSAER